MPARWTADIVAEMHLNGITAKELAAEANWHEKYLSAVLNGHREPKGAEQTVKNALQRLVARKSKM